MKLVTAVLLVLLFVPATAPGQPGGAVVIYGDNPGFSDCGLAEAVGVVNSVWVVHAYIQDATKAKFRVINSWTATPLGVDYHGNFPVGDIYTGVEVSYEAYGNPGSPGCALMPHLIAELQFIPWTPTPCGPWLATAPHPANASGEIEIVDCDANLLTAGQGETFYINPTWYHPMCDCDGPVGTEARTWGAIKSLYQ